MTKLDSAMCGMQCLRSRMLVAAVEDRAHALATGHLIREGACGALSLVDAGWANGDGSRAANTAVVRLSRHTSHTLHGDVRIARLECDTQQASGVCEERTMARWSVQ